jgi:hypothetical protein
VPPPPPVPPPGDLSFVQEIETEIKRAILVVITNTLFIITFFSTQRVINGINLLKVA